MTLKNIVRYVAWSGSKQKKVISSMVATTTFPGQKRPEKAIITYQITTEIDLTHFISTLDY